MPLKLEMRNEKVRSFPPTRDFICDGWFHVHGAVRRIHLFGFWFKHGLGAKLGTKHLDHLAHSNEHFNETTSARNSFKKWSIKKGLYKGFGGARRTLSTLKLIQ